MAYGPKPKSTLSRLLARTNRDSANGCWIWTGKPINSGYGRMSVISSPGNKRDELVHRISYQLHCGEVQPGQVVRHTCDNKLCINPKHLVVGTQWDNVHDAIDRGLARYPNQNLTHCRRGHAFDSENTIVAASGKRRCRACRNMKQRERQAKQRQLKRESVLSFPTLPPAKPFGRRRSADAALPAVVSPGALS